MPTFKVTYSAPSGVVQRTEVDIEAADEAAARAAVEAASAVPVEVISVQDLDAEGAA
jgi:hypothetical protein